MKNNIGNLPYKKEAWNPSANRNSHSKQQETCVETLRYRPKTGSCAEISLLRNYRQQLRNTIVPDIHTESRRLSSPYPRLWVWSACAGDTCAILATSNSHHFSPKGSVTLQTRCRLVSSSGTHSDARDKIGKYPEPQAYWRCVVAAKALKTKNWSTGWRRGWIDGWMNCIPETGSTWT